MSRPPLFVNAAGPAAADVAAGLRWTWIGAATAALLALALWAGGGYHAAFAPLNDLGRPLPGFVLEYLTFAGDGLFAALMVALLARHRPRFLVLALGAAVATSLLLHLVKDLFEAARPAAVLAADEFRLVGARYAQRSFPSGHATLVFSLAGVALAFARSNGQRAAWLALALAIGWSRVAVGAHWPVDVLAGAALGLAGAGIVVRCGVRWQGAARPAVYAPLLVLLAVVAVSVAFGWSEPDYLTVRVAARLLAVVVLCGFVYDGWRVWQRRSPA